jgi:uncharacterized Zn finger protein
MPRRSYDYDDYFPRSERIRTDKGIGTRSRTGRIGASWWAARWIAALERLIDAGRLSRGRSYARSGQVLSLEEKGSAIHARVQGSRPSPYRVTITLKPLSDAQWNGVVDRLAAEAAFAAQLLAGEMPAEIETAFAAAGASLFPADRNDLITECSCPDDSNPCKHIAAAHYILGEQFDEDPFLIFRLRGRTQEQILAALRARRTAQPALHENLAPYDASAGAAPREVPLRDLIDIFWQAAAPLSGLTAPVQPPPVPMPLLRRLGAAGFLPDHDLATLLGPAYTAIGKAAVEAGQ